MKKILAAFLSLCFFMGTTVYADGGANVKPAAHAVKNTQKTDQKVHKININSADAKALETLSGIGPAKSKAIIEYRQQHGAFKSVDELLKVKGISQKLLAKLREDITI